MTWKGFSRCLIEWGIAHLGCNVYLTRSSSHQHNLLVIVHTDQPFAGGRYFLRSSMKMAWLYSSWCHQTDILVGCKQSKKSDEGQTSDIIGPVSWVSAFNCGELWWSLISVETDCSSISTFTMGVENYDHWRNSAVARIIFQTFPINWQLVTDRFHSLKFWKMLLKISVLYQSVDTWQCDAHDYCLREARWQINHIFDIQWSLHYFSYILMTPSIRIAQPPRHDFGDFFSPLLWASDLSQFRALFYFTLIG